MVPGSYAPSRDVDRVRRPRGGTLDGWERHDLGSAVGRLMNSKRAE